jgi:hypothetical protein
VKRDHLLDVEEVGLGRFDSFLNVSA